MNRERGVVLLSDGQILPVTHWFAQTWVQDQEEAAGAADPSTAVCCTAGPDKDGRWFSIDLRGFTPVSTQ